MIPEEDRKRAVFKKGYCKREVFGLCKEKGRFFHILKVKKRDFPLLFQKSVKRTDAYSRHTGYFCLFRSLF